jgi:hypothetical protein
MVTNNKQMLSKYLDTSASTVQTFMRLGLIIILCGNYKPPQFASDF